MENDSGFRIYSLGIVVEAKPDLLDFILVCPIEQLNIQESGLIFDKITESVGKLKDTADKGFDTTFNSRMYFKAKWLPLSDSNRMTAPDVVANETVILFKFADVDEYFWTTLFREPGLRRQETVAHAYSNLKDGLTPFDNTTSYWHKIDTKNKIIHLHTSDNDGELTTYDITIDTKQGIFTLKDGRGNNIILNSSSDDLTVNTNNSINAIASNTINATAGSTITLTAPNIILNGNLTVNGNSTGNGTLSAGNTDINGNLSSTGDVTASQVNAGTFNNT